MADVNEHYVSDMQNGRIAHADTKNTRAKETEPSAESSDSEGGERPVRDKLKKTSIAGLSSMARAGGEKVPHPLHESTSNEPPPVISSDPASASTRGRPARKRSFDDLQKDGTSNPLMDADNDPPPAKHGHHKRMRSRDMSSGEHVSLAGRSENGAGTPVEEESDLDAQRSPGGPGVLVDATIDDAITPPPESDPDPYGFISPKKKRSRDQFDTEDHPDANASEAQNSSISQREGSEPDKKRHREEEGVITFPAPESKGQVAAMSGFGNASTASPFGTISSTRSPPRQARSPAVKPADASAFKSSGLSAFASSEKSPFGTVSGSTLSGFGGMPSSGGFGAARTGTNFAGTSTSGFANTGVTSPFKTTTGSGFGGLGGLSSSGGFTSGGLGSGLGAGLGSASAHLGGRLSPFGGAVTSKDAFGGPISSKQKAFGAPDVQEDIESGDDDAAEQDEGGDGEGEIEETHFARENRLKEQVNRETGEEDEEVVIKCRAKLYFFDKKEWKERGVGDLKVNVRFELKDNTDEETPQFERKARIIMRTEHVHRVVLNTPIFKEMKVGNQNGEEPNGRFLNIAGMENGKPALFMLKIGKEDVVKELYHRIKELQEEP